MKPSVTKKIHDKLTSNSSPSHIFNELFDEGGGIIGTPSSGSVPRSSKQISDIKGASKSKSSTKDTLYAVMEECKKEQSRATPYIRCVQAAPDPVCVLAFDRQMVRFCTNKKEYSVLGIDPTFSLGDFSVTVATYRNLLLLSKRTKMPPVMIGPIMVHQHKRKQDYHFFAASLVGLCERLQHVCAIGIDGEVAISSGFQVQFKESKHVLCFLHVKDNLKCKLHDIGVTGATADQFLKDVFGNVVGTTKIAGLVDCDTEEEFDTVLAGLEPIWDEREMSCTKTTEAKFFKWFHAYHAQNVKSCMLKPIRSAIGLGSPPAEYTNNANECVNAIIKWKTSYMASELHTFCIKMRELVTTQTRDI